MRIAVAQSAGVSRDPRATLAELPDLAGRAAQQGARLLVLPEMWLTGYNIGDATQELAEPADGPAATAVAEVARRHDLAILYGFPERAGERVYNAAQLIGADGAVLVCYRKTHLFGEAERAQFTAGNTAVLCANLDGFRLAIMICYDVEFPEAVRAAALDSADAVLVPTALFQPFDFVARKLVPVRAWENGVYLAYANRCGQEGELGYVGCSVICGPDGGVLSAAEAGPELLTAELSRAAIDRARAASPYLRDLRPELFG